MNKEQQRIAIAELCGWKRGVRRVGTEFEGPAWLIPSGRSHMPHEWFGVDNLPDYINDLNAMHEAEKGLTEDQWLEYREELRTVILGGIRLISQWCKADLHATASKRAEAFLRTMGKWVE